MEKTPPLEDLGSTLIELINAIKNNTLHLSEIQWLLSLPPKVREQMINDSRPSAILARGRQAKIDLPKTLRELEERTIRNALERMGWNKKAVAEQLSLSIHQLQARMEAFGIESPDSDPLSDSARKRIASIREALEKTDWHQGKAAALLGVSPQAICEQMRRYKIKRPPKNS